jgi:hypothetical protein
MVTPLPTVVVQQKLVLQLHLQLVLASCLVSLVVVQKSRLLVDCLRRSRQPVRHKKQPRSKQRRWAMDLQHLQRLHLALLRLLLLLLLLLPLLPLLQLLQRRLRL